MLRKTPNITNYTTGESMNAFQSYEWARNDNRLKSCFGSYTISERRSNSIGGDDQAEITADRNVELEIRFHEVAIRNRAKLNGDRSGNYFDAVEGRLKAVRDQIRNAPPAVEKPYTAPQ